MPTDLSYEDIWHSFLVLEYLIFELDYVMWLCIKHQGSPDETPVSLVEEPRAAFETARDIYLEEHRDELIPRRLKCRKCGQERMAGFGHRTCPTERFLRRRIDEKLSVDEASQLLLERCGGELYDITDHHQYSENWFREQAGFAMATRGDLVSRLDVASAWIVQEFYRKQQFEDGDTVRAYATDTAQRHYRCGRPEGNLRKTFPRIAAQKQISAGPSRLATYSWK